MYVTVTIRSFIHSEDSFGHDHARQLNKFLCEIWYWDLARVSRRSLASKSLLVSFLSWASLFLHGWFWSRVTEAQKVWFSQEQVSKKFAKAGHPIILHNRGGLHGWILPRHAAAQPATRKSSPGNDAASRSFHSSRNRAREAQVAYYSPQQWRGSVVLLNWTLLREPTVVSESCNSGWIITRARHRCSQFPFFLQVQECIIVL